MTATKLMCLYQIIQSSQRSATGFQVVVTQGEDLKEFLLVLEGVIELRTRRPERHRSAIRSLKRGSSYGESQLLRGAPADATGIVASATCVALVASRASFLACLEPLLKASCRGALGFLATTSASCKGVSRYADSCFGSPCR